jgi:hypothetical protein
MTEESVCLRQEQQNISVLHRVQAGCMTHAVSYPVDTRNSLPEGQSIRSAKMKSHLQPVPSLRMSGVLPQFPYTSSWRDAYLSTEITSFLILLLLNLTVLCQLVTSPTSGVRSVGMIRLQTKATSLVYTLAFPQFLRIRLHCIDWESWLALTRIKDIASSNLVQVQRILNLVVVVSPSLSKSMLG